MSDNLKKTGLELLREPFPTHQISKLPKPTKEQTDVVKADFKKGIRCKLCGAWHHPQVVHLDYVGHAAMTDRLLDCDPGWNWEPLAFTSEALPAFDKTGGLWIKLTVCGVTRLGYGHAPQKPNQDPGNREKEVIGDALRNAAMRFGAALDLWHKGDLHADREDAPEDYDKPVETSLDNDMPFDDGPDLRHDECVAREVRKMWTITDLDEFKSYWSALNKAQPDVAADKLVVKAKDEVKAAIMAKMKEAAG